MGDTIKEGIFSIRSLHLVITSSPQGRWLNFALILLQCMLMLRSCFVELPCIFVISIVKLIILEKKKGFLKYQNLTDYRVLSFLLSNNLSS